MYISTFSRIRKVDGNTAIITTIAGTGTTGFSGDGGAATNAELYNSYGLFADDVGNVYFADLGNNRIRRIDAITGIITTIAGGGTSFGDGGAATNAQLSNPANVYGDNTGNFYIGDRTRIRKVNGATGIISTIAGTGISGLSGDGGLATNAQVSDPSGMLFDAYGNFYFAGRGNSRIRKINTSTGIITTFAGTTDGYSGDYGPATAAQLSGPICFVFDVYDNMVIGDNQNNVMRKIDVSTNIITTIAGVGTSISGSSADGIPATDADIHPEFMCIDQNGNIYFSTYDVRLVRKVTNYNLGLLSAGFACGFTSVREIAKESDNAEIYPNPTIDELHIKTTPGLSNGEMIMTNSMGQIMLQQQITKADTDVPVSRLPAGVYFVIFRGEYGVKVERFVKE